MFNERSLTPGRMLPTATFDQILAVLHEVAQIGGSEAFLFTNASLPLSEWLAKTGIQRFAVVVSARFSGLLQIPSVPGASGQSQMPASEQNGSGRQIPQDWCNVELKFDPAAIADFLLKLSEQLPPQLKVHHRLEYASQVLQPNDVNLQGEFSLRLAEVLTVGQGGDRVSPAQRLVLQPDAN